MKYEKPLTRVRRAVEDARREYESRDPDAAHETIVEALEELADVIDHFIREHSR